MSAAIIADNTSLKVNSAVSAVSTNASTSGTLFNCPANSYAILNGYCSAQATNNNASILVDGRPVLAAVSSNSSLGTYSSVGGNDGGDKTSIASFNIYVGPGQSVTYSKTSGASAVAAVSGVVFVNSP